MCKHLQDKEKISQRVESFDDGFAIDGCCGGGCVVIEQIVFCPFCGKRIFKVKDEVKEGG